MISQSVELFQKGKKAVQGQSFCQDSSTGSVEGRRIRKVGRLFSEELNKCMSKRSFKGEKM